MASEIDRPVVERLDVHNYATWRTRMKFLLIAALAHAFLILLLAPRFAKLKQWLLDTWCHRNGKWSRETPTPLYRLRLALSQLWRVFRPLLLPLLI